MILRYGGASGVGQKAAAKAAKAFVIKHCKENGLEVPERVKDFTV